MIHFGFIQLRYCFSDLRLMLLFWNQSQFCSHNKVTNWQIKGFINDAKMSYLLVYFVCFHGFINCDCGYLHNFSNHKILYQLYIKTEKLTVFFNRVQSFLGWDKYFSWSFGLEVKASNEIFHEDGIFCFFYFFIFEGLRTNKL